MSERQQHFAYLPAHDGHGAATFGLSENCQAASPMAPNRPRPGWTTAAAAGDGLLLERQELPADAQRHAFELGFLSRIHQRLCSPLGGGHLARRTELQL